MNLLYLANIRFPTEKAHGAQIAKACEAFADAGVKVELVVPRRKTPIIEDPFTYYAIERNFIIRTLFTLDTVRWGGRIGFFIQACSFAIPAALYARKKSRDIIYSRDEIVAALAIIAGQRNVMWESHDGAWNPIARFVAHRAAGMVVVTDGAKDFYVSHGVPVEKIVVIQNGIDVNSFKKHESKDKARARLGIPKDAFVALYVGALDGWKGTDTLFEASHFVEKVTIVIIGGDNERVKILKKQYPRVLFLGQRPYRELPDNLVVADVCVLPNTAHDSVSITFTCPMKLLAYMAAGKPIVASDLPSVRELTGENTALLVPPDNPKALAEGIIQLCQHPNLAEKFARAAQKKAYLFTWSHRTHRLIDWISER